MKLKTRKKAYIIVFIIMFVVFIFTKSFAKALNSQADLMSSRNIGNTIELSREGERSVDKTGLMWNQYMYCFQHEKYCGESNYTIQAYVEIDGDKATRYYNNDATSGTTVTKNANLGLGYLFQHGSFDKGYFRNGRQTLRQRALWEYGDTWMSDVGSSFNMNWKVGAINKETDNFADESSYTYKNLASDAETYANKGAITDPKVEFINTSTEYDNTSNGTVFGPFKVSLNHTRMKVSSIVLKDSDGKAMSSGISFFSDSAGKNSLNINNLTSGSSFYIKNTTNSDVGSVTVNVETDPIYKAQMWFLYDNDSSHQRLLSVKPSSYTKKSSAEIKLTTTGTLYLYKADEETNETLQGAGFKIYKNNSGWQKGTTKPFEYVTNINDATEYVMDNNNKTSYVQYLNYDGSSNEYKNKKVLKISGLKAGIYHVYETKAPTGGYKLNLQNGYDSQKGYVDIGNDIKIGSNSANGYSFNRIINIINVQKISIAGYVWTEGKPEKPEDSSYDNVFINNSDHRVNNVTVKLFKKGNSNPIVTAITDTNGYYKFTDVVKRTELDNYYVEFDYKEGKYSYTKAGKTINMTMKDSHGHIRYIPVAFKNVENGSKAMSQTIPLEDVNVGSVAYTYNGNTNNMINTYGLSKIGTMDNVNLVLNNINLGIKEMLEPKISVINNIADVRISINGYNYNYKYGGTEDKAKFTDYTQEGPAVKWQNRSVSYAYSRPVYPSDVKYDEMSTKKELDVKVTYRIDITNITTYNVKELYVEDKLLLNKITDKFDSRRYTLADNNWKADNGIATIENGYLQEIQTKNGKKGIDSQGTVTAYITFNVNRDAIIDILNHPDGIIENNPTEASAEGYHEYYRDDYSWNNNIKKDKQKHKTENNEEKAEAPYLVFTIKPDGIKERTVSGKVFKDNVTAERGNSGEVVGDGKYQDDSEKGVSGVKVELLGEDMKVTKLYQAYTENEIVKTRVIDAVVITDGNGTYSLNGVVPGKYYLRFTYGNGQYKITDLTGTTLKEGTYETKIQESTDTINAAYFKSTIRNSGLVDLIRNKAELWYLEDDFAEEKYSVALDDTGKRKAINENEEIKEMNADSSKISVKIEKTKQDEAQEIPATSNSAIQGKTLLNDQNKNIKYNFNGFYFGLIEMPKTRADIKKLITNVKITNSQGNVLYDGNPENISKQGAGAVTITDLDNETNGGSSYVRAEMVEVSIYGSLLELTYQVNVTNTSDVNYYTENYYLYGNKGDGSKEVTIIPKIVNDYLDKVITYQEKESTKLNNNIKRINEIDDDKLITIDGKDVKVEQLELTGWGKLYTNKIKNRDENHPTTDSVNIFAKRTLSREDNDMEIVSYATITKVENSTSGDDVDEGIKLVRKAENVNANAKARFTLFPPTGGTADSLTYYAIAGIISLIVIAGGIVTIKKKII